MVRVHSYMTASYDMLLLLLVLLFIFPKKEKNSLENEILLNLMPGTQLVEVKPGRQLRLESSIVCFQVLFPNILQPFLYKDSYFFSN